MTSKLALVTGASCGVGFALAEQFARRGYDLIVADSYDEINTAAAALAILGTDVQAEQIDLSRPDSAYLLHRRVMAAGRAVNAAALTVSVKDASFSDSAIEAALEEVDGSVRGIMVLARRQAERMVALGHGGIALAGSPANRMPGLDTAVYSATSALLQAFAEILNEEVSECGVKVVSVMPQPMSATAGGLTNLMSRGVRRPPADAPAEVARDAVEALSSDDQQGIAARATEAVASLAGRLVSNRVKGPVRQIISPTGEAI